ncbi:MAG TPA: HAD-IA family hydrolase [Candidatus Udaeobacter sp.]|nr:HAD-IA family hydrolase [Candidatus Udaeobacter sp.]
MIAIDALIYDLDGTLIDSQLDLAHSVNAALADAGRPPKPVAQVASYVGDGVAVMLERAFEDATPVELMRALAVYRAHYRAHCLDHTRLYPGVRSTLEHFRHKRQAVVSNKPADFSRLIVAGLGLSEVLPVVIGGDTAGALKPDPAPVRAALAALGVGPHQAVMVGDGLTDLEAGRRAGLRTCAATYGLNERAVLAGGQPDYWINEFSALERLFV